MHDFMRSILEDKYGWECDFTSGSARLPGPPRTPSTTPTTSSPWKSTTTWPARTSPASPATSCCWTTSSELGYDVDFKVSLAKLEKDDSGRITGVIAQNMDDDHFIRYNAAKGVLLACGGYAGNPYMMEQLDPLGTSVTTACSYSPADQGLRHPRCCVGRCQPGQGIRSHAV